MSDRLPAWAQEMRDLFKSGSVSQFILHGNIFDLVPSGDGRGRCGHAVGSCPGQTTSTAPSSSQAQKVLTKGVPVLFWVRCRPVVPSANWRAGGRAVPAGRCRRSVGPPNRK